MSAHRSLALLCLGLFLGTLGLTSAPRATRAVDASDGTAAIRQATDSDHVYAVVDFAADGTGSVVRFRSEFWRLGGVAEIGNRISLAYQDQDGFFYQLFQKALLQWRPELNRAFLANIMDRMSEMGADSWLSRRGIPYPQSDGFAGGGDPVAGRLAWLTEPHIRSQYL